MSRRHAAQKREVIPDPKFNDLVVTKFMNAVMEDGKIIHRGQMAALAADAGLQAQLLGLHLKGDAA